MGKKHSLYRVYFQELPSGFLEILKDWRGSNVVFDEDGYWGEMDGIWKSWCSGSMDGGGKECYN